MRNGIGRVQIGELAVLAKENGFILDEDLSSGDR